MALTNNEIKIIFFENCMEYSNGDLELMCREGLFYEKSIGWNNDTLYGKKLTECVKLLLKFNDDEYINPNQEVEYKSIFLQQIFEVIALRKSGGLVLHYATYPLVKRTLDITTEPIYTKNERKHICSQCHNELHIFKDILHDGHDYFVHSIHVKYALLGIYHLDLCAKCKSVYDSFKEMKDERSCYTIMVETVNELLKPNLDSESNN